MLTFSWRKQYGFWRAGKAVRSEGRRATLGSNPKLFELVNDGLGSFHFNQDLVINIGPFDEPATGVQPGKQVSIRLLEQKSGSDNGVAGEEFVNFAQENVEAYALSRRNAEGVCLREEACAWGRQINLVVNLERGFR